MLYIKDLHKSFGEQHVLRGIDLSIEQGALTAIIGPNGCGKSTLFNVITGELSASEGTCFFQGQSLLGKRPRDIAQLGILRKFQVPGIYPNLTVAEHLGLPFVIAKQRKDSTLIAKTAEKMGLSGLLAHYGRVLATGQKQWLELAMLVLLKPTLLLLDEPIAGMTETETQQTLAQLRQLNRDGLTIVTIEHNMDFVKQLASDIVVIMNGKVAMRSDYPTIAADSHIREHYLGSLYGE